MIIKHSAYHHFIWGASPIRIHDGPYVFLSFDIPISGINDPLTYSGVLGLHFSKEVSWGEGG